MAVPIVIGAGMLLWRGVAVGRAALGVSRAVKAGQGAASVARGPGARLAWQGYRSGHALNNRFGGGAPGEEIDDDHPRYAGAAQPEGPGFFGTAVRTVGGAAGGAVLGGMIGGPGGAAIGGALGGWWGMGGGRTAVAAGAGMAVGALLANAASDQPEAAAPASTAAIPESTPMETAPSAGGPETLQTAGPELTQAGGAPEMVNADYQDPTAGAVAPDPVNAAPVASTSGIERMDVIPQPSTGPSTWGNYTPESGAQSPMDVQGPATTAGAQVQAARLDGSGPNGPGAMRDQTRAFTGESATVSV